MKNLQLHLPNLMAYYQACYQADNRALQISNFLGNKVEKRLWLPSSELIDGRLRYYPVKTEWARQMKTQLILNQKEKELLLGAFFITGLQKVAFQKTKQEVVATPLFLIKVDLVSMEDIFYLKLKEEPFIINPAAIQILEKVKQVPLKSEQFSDAFDQIVRELPVGLINFDECVQIEKTLKARYSFLDLSLIFEYPNLKGQRYVRTQLKKVQSENLFQLIPALTVGLVSKSKATRGVITELGELSKSKDFSAPIVSLINTSKQVMPPPESKALFSPANLSLSQEKIIQAANHFPITQVFGPPGTGKSFTIAALTIDALSRGQTVLISSKYDQAVDVIAKKIEQDIGVDDIIMRVGNSRNHKSALRKKLKNLLYGLGQSIPADKELKRLYNQVLTQHKGIEKVKKQLDQREETELQRSAFLQNETAGFLNLVKRLFIERKIQKADPYWLLVQQWERLIQRRSYFTRLYAKKIFLKRLNLALEKDRSVFVDLMNALRQGNLSNGEDIADHPNFKLLLKALPIWLSNATEVNQVLPLQKELFDLVIIDEASQCDIASSMPLLQRAKRAVIVGDPKQLKHLSFLSEKRASYLQEQYLLDPLRIDPLLDYNNKSLLDICIYKIKSQNQIHYLNEHYRSKPDIIDFSNSYFYEDTLNIMTKHPNNRNSGNIFVHVGKSKRNAKGVNVEEAESLLEKMSDLINIYKYRPKSIGILSPFRAQVDYLKKRIASDFEVETLEKFQLLVGTPYHFQGEEKDIMLLSFAIDKDTHAATYNYLNRTDIFNVSITRAKEQQHLFLSDNLYVWKKDLLLAKYLFHIKKAKSTQEKIYGVPDKDSHLHELRACLLELGIQIRSFGGDIAGFEVDIICTYKENNFAIDLVGFPGEYEKAFPSDKYQMLQRMGIKTLIIPFGLWSVDQGLSIKHINRFLKNY